MAQYRLNAYDADVFIPEFKGIYTYGDQMGGDLRYAEEASNVETTGGVLQASRAIGEFDVKDITSGDYYDLSRDSKIVWIPEETVTPPIPNNATQTGAPCAFGQKDVFLIFDNNHSYRVRWLYWHYVWRAAYSISELTLPSNAGLPSSWVNYEFTSNNTPVICTMISFPTKGLYKYTQGSFTKVDNAPAGGKFDFMERYAERLWGVKGDTVYYSHPFDMENWDQDNDNPANGGGEIRLASWDDDKLTAMKAFGDCLVIFSEKRAWKIQGSDPSNFMIQEQFGNGCRHPNSIVVDNNRLLMIQDRSIAQYDGYTISKISTDLHTAVFFKNNIYDDAILKSASATMVEDHYLINVGVVVRNDEVQMIDYNTKDGTIVFKTYPNIVQFCKGVPIGLAYHGTVFDPETHEVVTPEHVGILALEESDLWEKNVGATVHMTEEKYVYPPGETIVIEWDERATYATSPAAAKWVSPWITLGREDIKKGGFELYFTPEVLKNAVTLQISIQTEKKTKTKSYTIQPLNHDEYHTLNKRHKMKRLHFGGTGRRFRVIIECAEGNTHPWRLVGGIQIVAETDRD